MTTSSVQNRNPPITGGNRIPASVSTTGPATARTHPTTRRVGDSCLVHRPLRPPTNLTTLRLTSCDGRRHGFLSCLPLDDTPVFHELSFTVGGGRTGLVAPNGAGKSTLL
ncbi:hypothetical protein GCM10009609_05420 [Pseudonocardia aurantiaca]